MYVQLSYHSMCEHAMTIEIGYCIASYCIQLITFSCISNELKRYLKLHACHITNKPSTPLYEHSCCLTSNMI